ncbi:MAG: DUF2070 family protein, partial [Methanosarcinaceae archaeon]|nr:DUF2070 family protein [Methanosarcinaceae archaeon]
MQKINEDKIDKLIKYMFTTPSWFKSFYISFILSIIVGIVALRFGEGILEGVISGLILIGIPSILSTIGTYLVTMWSNEKISMSGSLFLSMVCVIVISIICIFGAIISYFFNTHIIFHAYITALGAIFVIRMIAIFITSKSNILKVVAPASLQT